MVGAAVACRPASPPLRAVREAKIARALRKGERAGRFAWPLYRDGRANPTSTVVYNSNVPTMNGTTNYLTNLRQTLTSRFDESELRDLCFDMRIDYDALPVSH